MRDDEKSDSGSFATGFTVGMFAGALGYFVFGTQKGKGVRLKLMSEWENAKEKLARETGMDVEQVSLSDMVNKAKDYLSVFLQGMEPSQQTKKSEEKGSPAKNSLKKSKKKLFKGV